MIKRLLIASAITIALFKSGIFVFATPVPALFLFVKYGRKEGFSALATLMLIALAAFLTGYVGRFEFLYFCYYGLIGLFLGEGFVRKFDIFRLSGVAILSTLAVMGIFFLLLYSDSYGNIIQGIRTFVVQGMDEAISLQSGVAALTPQQLAYLTAEKASIADFMLKVMPSALVVFSLLVVSVTLLLTNAMTKKSGGLKYLGNVAMKELPFWPVWSVIVCGMAFLADSYVVHNEYLRFVAINGLFCCSGFFFIQGCFVVTFWMQRFKSPFLRLAVYGLIFAFMQFMGLVLIALGLSDNWVGFRKKVVNKIA